MMPYYGMPVGTDYEEVGFGFNRQVITGLLRELGFDGIVCTDWGLLIDAQSRDALAGPGVGCRAPRSRRALAQVLEPVPTSSAERTAPTS